MDTIYIKMLTLMLLILFIIICCLLNCSLNTDTYQDTYQEIDHDTYHETDQDIEHLINVSMSTKEIPTWSQTKCSYRLNETMHHSLNKNASLITNHSESDLVVPCGYDYIDKEINAIPQNNESDPRRVFIIQGADEITAKNYLWKNIIDYYGIDRAKKLAPNTYLLTEPQRSDEIKRLEKEHLPGKKYILKKNIQRQTGLKITNQISEIKKNVGYVVAQELLQDSYLVNNRKINLRVYVVVLCHKNSTDVYVFNDGFMYYTQKEFIRDSQNIEPVNHITTGYVDRDVYVKNPLTHTDFKNYLDSKSGIKYHPDSSYARNLNPTESMLRQQGIHLSEYVFNNIYDLIKHIFIALKKHICKKKDNFNNNVHIYNDYSVQIFGADVAINDKLDAQIIEINKGPDLSPKDQRDGTVKMKLMNDVLEIIGMKTKTNDNGLILVLES
jgi:hypothetical protein